jgi:hypothetical protein
VRWGLIKVAVPAIAGVIVLAGCSAKEGGIATAAPPAENPSDTSPTASSRTVPGGSGNAPKIENPLDASKYLTQPCAVLSPAQLQAFKITKPGTPHVDDPVAKQAGPYCGWRSDDAIPFGFDVGFLTGNKNGLSDTLEGGKKAFPGYFEPTEVEGYPAVFNDVADRRPTGACNITVGISENLAFRAQEQANKSTGARSCDGAKQLAAAVIQTLRSQ